MRTAARVAAAAAAIGAFTWFELGAIVPATSGGTIEYIIVLPGVARLLVDCVIAAAAIVAIHVTLGATVFRPGDASRDWSYWRPSWLLAFVWMSVPAALQPDRWWSAPLLYLTADLAPVLAGAAALLWIRLVLQRARKPAHVRGADLILGAVVIVFAIATTPMLRFSSVLHGDEPKYMRFCENLYQGRGFEIGDISPIPSLPANLAPQFGDDLRSAVTEIGADLHRLRLEVRAAAGGDADAFSNRARYAGAWFVTGRRGGLYQVHTPGLSFLLMPGYVVDRFLLNWSASEASDQVPERLAATDGMMLLTYALWAIALTGLLRRYTGDPLIAWVVAAVCLMTLPVAAFPFQIYPEIAAGLIVTLAVAFVLFDDRRSSGRAIGVGVLAAFLLWLHIRFAALSLVIAAAVLVTRLRRPRQAIGFAAAYAATLALFCLYVFHITGSLRPDALYFTQGNVDPLAPTNIPRGLVAYLFDGTWGLIASAPVFLLAFTGGGVMIRRRPDAALLAAALALSLAAPSAAHSYRGAGATPLRHVVAVVPLAALPLAEAWRRYRRSRLFTAVFAVLALVSIYTAARYNLFHVKEIGPFVDESASGWKPNLLFPALDYGAVTWFRLWAWIAAAAVLVIWPLAPRGRRVWSLALAAALGAIVIAGRVPVRSPNYLPPPAHARLDLIRAVDDGAIIRSSRRWRLSARVVAGNPGALYLNPDVTRLRINQSVRFTVGAVNDEQAATWGRLTMDFGDGTPPHVSTLVGSGDLRHTYRSAGLYQVRARLELPSGERIEATWPIGVRSDQGLP